MRELTPYGVDNISVKGVVKVCFEEATNDSSAQWLEFRIYTGFWGCYFKKKINIMSFDSRGFRQKNVETIAHIFFLVIKFLLCWMN